MPTYRVTWVIDVDADHPRDAANQARAIQMDPDSTATVFEVAEEVPNSYGTVHRIHRVDLAEEDEAAVNAEVARIRGQVSG